MGHRFIPTLTLALLLLPLCSAGMGADGAAKAVASGPAGQTVAVHTVDEATIRGTLVAVANDSITIEVGAEKKPGKRTTVPLTDVAQVVFREPAPKAKPAPMSEAADTNNGDAPKSLIQAIFSIFSSDDETKPDSDAPPPPPKSKPANPTTAPADTSGWHILLVNGDSLHARVTQWSGPTLHVKLNAPLAQDAEIPSDQVAQVWCGSAGAIARATALHHDASAEDIAFVEKDKDIIPVNGHAIGIDAGALKFHYGDTDRKIALGRLVGIVFGSRERASPSGGFHQSVSLDSGDTLSGVWSGLDKNAVVLRTTWGPAVRVPFGSIDTVDFVNGRLVYLSDLTPAKVEQTPYFGRVVPFRLDQSLDGEPLKLGDEPCAKGIAVHSRCVLVYETGGTYERFRSRLGFDLPAGRLGRVAVRVRAGDRVLYENPDLRGDQPPADLDLDIIGQRQLTLEVDFGKGQDVGDRVIWGNARLVRSNIQSEPGK